ncbi:hypothetical protein DL98DRAFT_594541 [Cadophora sp. DSE1049]|nr:hypothetical protein DL98DRAFT_594541 [Cadophora sp. DSE1049]
MRTPNSSVAQRSFQSGLLRSSSNQLRKESSKPFRVRCSQLMLLNVLSSDCVRGNSLRGRKIDRVTLNIWFLDDDMFPPIKNLITNQSLQRTLPTLVGDTWGEKSGKGLWLPL